jgi:hypothetical protein
MKRYGFTLSFIVLFVAATAQVSVKDSAISTAMFYVDYSYQFPQGDIAERFGPNSSIGGGFAIKTRSNWLISFEGNYLFGSGVKNQDSLLVLIRGAGGYIIDANGMYADIIFYERGYNLFAGFGKLFPILSPNPNSGFTLMVGAGYNQNWIRILNPNNTAPQVYGDYNKGYDKLNGGFALSGSIGYLFMSNTRLLNFSLGFEFIQTWTHSKRPVDFDTGQPDPANLSTQYYGIKACWFIPLFKRKPKSYYYY